MNHPDDAMVTAAELTVLRLLALRSKTWAMIGVGLGGTAREMIREWADAWGDGRSVLLVDPYQQDPMTWKGQRYLSDQAMFEKAQREVDWAEGVWLIRSRSEDAAKEEIGPIGFVFIDGNHADPHPSNDFWSWCDFVPPNGIIAFHDTDLSGPERAYREARETKNWIDLGQVGTLGIIRRAP